jgi:hypothetical protein
MGHARFRGNGAPFSSLRVSWRRKERGFLLDGSRRSKIWSLIPKWEKFGKKVKFFSIFPRRIGKEIL